MTLNNKIFYKYIESLYTQYNYKDEFSTAIEEFFDSRNIIAVWCTDNSNPTKYLLITIHTEVDTDVLIDSAIDFSKEFDVDFVTLTKEFTTYFENNHKTDVSVSEYRLVFERRNMVA